MNARSWLFVPGDSEKKLAKVANSPADAIIIDLEDAVASERKPAARQLTAALLADSARRHRATWVRVNAFGSAWLADDLDAIVAARPDGLVLPKINSVAEIEGIDRCLRDLVQGGLPLLPLTTETARGALGLSAYRDLPPPVVGLTWGAEDLAADIGALRNRDEQGRWLAPFELARSLCLLAAAANALPAIDTVYTDYKDTDGLAAYASGARQLGFSGMLAVHPGQVPVINAAFTPTADEIAAAQAVLAAFAAADGAGVATLNGQMLDEPHRRQAERVLASAAAEDPC